MKLLRILRHAAPLPAVVTIVLIQACAPESDPEFSAASESGPAGAVRATPRYDDGTVQFDRVRGEAGYWGRPSTSSLVEDGVDVEMDSRGLLANIDDAARVAPFQPWALALYQYRQRNAFADDPLRFCISPGGPRHLMDDRGFRIIQDRNYERVYLMFGGGNRNWRLIFLDGRQPPDPEEVVGTYYGYSSGHWDGDTLVVESSGFNDRFWFSNGGLPHTAALSLTERFSRPDYDTLLYQVTIDDPLTYTRPWSASWTLQWMAGDEIEEHFCEQ
jgi:hypothetical protein